MYNYVLQKGYIGKIYKLHYPTILDPIYIKVLWYDILDRNYNIRDISNDKKYFMISEEEFDDSLINMTEKEEYMINILFK